MKRLIPFILLAALVLAGLPGRAAAFDAAVFIRNMQAVAERVMKRQSNAGRAWQEPRERK